MEWGGVDSPAQGIATVAQRQAKTQTGVHTTDEASGRVHENGARQNVALPDAVREEAGDDPAWGVCVYVRRRFVRLGLAPPRRARRVTAANDSTPADQSFSPTPRERASRPFRMTHRSRTCPG